MSQDLYEALGVSSEATAKDIKRAWQKAARTWHPDLNPGDDQAAENYRQAQHAWEVLGDSSARASYDFGRRSGSTPAGNPSADSMWETAAPEKNVAEHRVKASGKWAAVSAAASQHPVDVVDSLWGSALLRAGVPLVAYVGCLALIGWVYPGPYSLLWLLIALLGTTALALLGFHSRSLPGGFTFREAVSGIYREHRFLAISAIIPSFSFISWFLDGTYRRPMWLIPILMIAAIAAQMFTVVGVYRLLNRTSVLTGDRETIKAVLDGDTVIEHHGEEYLFRPEETDAKLLGRTVKLMSVLIHNFPALRIVVRPASGMWGRSGIVLVHGRRVVLIDPVDVKHIGSTDLTQQCARDFFDEQFSTCLQAETQALSKTYRRAQVKGLVVPMWADPLGVDEETMIAPPQDAVNIIGEFFAQEPEPVVDRDLLHLVSWGHRPDTAVV